MPPGVRKAALVGHVTASVGWLGAVAAFLVLAVTALHTTDDATMRSSYVAMEVLGRAVLAPLAAASLVTGLVQSLGTSWGLVRHWWVIVKLAITVVATVVLLAYTNTLSLLGGAVRLQAPRPHPARLAHAADRQGRRQALTGPGRRRTRRPPSRQRVLRRADPRAFESRGS